MKNIQNDSAALTNYISAVNKGNSVTDSFSLYLSGASQSAQNYARSLEVQNGKIINGVDEVRKYLNSSKSLEVSNMALDKSFKNCSSIIKEYNSNFKNTKLSQEDFIAAVGASNNAMGQYLSGLNGSSASMKGYAKTLVSAKAETIGLQVASTALNMALSMGIALAIQLVISGISKLVNYYDDLADKVNDVKTSYNDAQNTISSHAQTINEISDRYEQLSSGVDVVGNNVSLTTDEFEEYNSICNQIADMYPSLVQGWTEQGNAILKLKGNVEGLTEAYNQEKIAANNALISESKDIMKDSNKAFKELNKVFEGANGSSPSDELNKFEYDFLKGAYSSDNIESYINQQDMHTFAANLKEYFDENLGDYFEENEDANLEDWYQIDMNSGVIVDEEKLSKILKDNKTLILSQLDTFEAELESAISGKRSLAEAYFSNQVLKSGDEETAASKLSEKMQNVVSSVINNMDYDTAIGLQSYDDVQNYVNGIVESLSSLSAENQGKITTLLDIQAKYNGGDCTVEEYQEAMQAAEEAISGLDEDTRNDVSVAIGLDDTEFKEKYEKVLNVISKNTDVKNAGAIKDWLDNLDKSKLEIAAELSADTDSATWSLEQWKDKVEREFVVDAAINFDITTAETNIDNLQKAVQESISSEFGLSSESKSLIESMFGSLDGYDSSRLFDRLSTGIRLNTEELNKLQKQQSDIQKQNFDEALNKLYQEYGELTTQIQNCDNVGSEEYNTLIDSRNAIVDKINNIADLQSEYEGLTSVYAKWQYALASGEEGDMYDNIRSEYEKAQDLYSQGLVGTSEFESYMELLTGKDWNTASYDEITEAWRGLSKEIGNTGYSIKDFLAEGSAGVENFLKASSKIKDSGITEEDGIFNINIDDFDDLADKLGVSEDLIESLLKKARDYKFDIEFTDPTDKFVKSITEAQEASEKLRNMGLTEMHFDFSTSDINSVDEQISEIERLYSSLPKEENGQIDLSVNGAAEVLSVYETLLNRKQQLNNPIIMDVDVGKIDDEELASDIQEVQQIISKNNEIEIQAKLGNDTTELKSELNELINGASESGNQILFGLDIDENTSFEDIQNKINEWCKDPNNAQLLVNAGIDDSRLAEESDKVKEYIQNAINGIKVELDFDNPVLDKLFGTTITVDADTSEANAAIDDTESKKDELTKNDTVEVDGDITGAISSFAQLSTVKAAIGQGVTTDVDADTSGATNKLNIFQKLKNLISNPVGTTVTANTSSATSALSGVLNKLYNIAKTWTANVITKVTGSTGTVNKSTGAAKSVRGSGKVNGTANAYGNIGAKKTETALMGEIAPELWVHADTGTWELVENPQFRKVRKGDIIFNGNQTEDLLKKGVIDSFGNAFLSGTAYAGATGGGKFPHSSGSSSSSKSNSSKSSSSKSSSKSSSSSKASEDAEETLETIDWIEIAIDRIERSIDQLDRTASSVYKTWSTRNTALKNQISDISKEIDLQSRGYQRYLQEANSVGLSSSLADRVKNGTIDINEYDSDTQELIKDYQEWYEKALDCKEAIEELKETQAGLYKQAFDNVSTQYDGILKVIDYKKSMLDEFLSQSEEKGLIESTNYYNALITQEQENIKQLNAEKDSLLKALESGMSSGLIDKSSEAWYEMCNDIDDVTMSIEEANTALLEYNNNIRDIQWQIFDLLQDRISQVADESDFLIDLMENDKLYDDRGQLTNEGKSTMGLHGVNYNIYMAQADKYAAEMEKINKQLANDPYNQDLVDRKQELLELQQESILAAEDEKDAIVDMVKDGIELELDSLQDLIDKYTDALDAQKDLYDYQKDVKEQAEEIASIQKQLSAYAGDTSEESKAKIQQLKVSLDEAQEDLEETEYDKYISDQKQLLDELYNEYELILNARLDNIDLLISDMISMINSNASDISTTISDKADSVGYTLTDSMNTIWNSSTEKVTSVLTTYGQNIVNGITTASTSVNAALNNINTNIAGMITAINKMANTNIQAVTSSGGSKSSATTSSQANTSKKNNTSNSSSSKTSSSSSSSSWGSWFIRKKDSYPKNKLRTNTSIVDRLKYFDFDSSMSARKKYYSKMGGSGTYTGSSKQNVWMIQQMKAHGYKNGKYNLPADEFAWTQEGGKPEVIIRPSDGAILTPLAKSDSVLNAEATENLWKMVKDPSDFIRSNSLSSIKPAFNDNKNIGTFNGNCNFEVVLPNVKNYEEFKSAMKHDRNFEKFIRSISIDRMFKSSSLNKYK